MDRGGASDGSNQSLHRHDRAVTDASYTNILVPTDGSDLALRPLKEPFTLAALTGGNDPRTLRRGHTKVAELTTDSGFDDVSFDTDVDCCSHWSLQDTFQGRRDRTTCFSETGSEC